MICRLCLEQGKKFADSHVIPRASYKVIKAEPNEPVFIIDRTGKARAYKSFSGIYDKEILCVDCEAEFKLWDDHAQKVLFAELANPIRVLDKKGTIAAYELKAAEYEKLKLFFISVLWKASISKQSFFSKINLGAIEDKLRQHILDREAGESDDFSVIISRFYDLDDLLPNMFEPRRETVDGIDYCILYLPTYKIDVKVDARPLPDRLRPFMLTPDKPCLINLLDFKRSIECKAAIEMVRGEKNRTSAA